MVDVDTADVDTADGPPVDPGLVVTDRQATGT
jgi:hypothetical protein